MCRKCMQFLLVNLTVVYRIGKWIEQLKCAKKCLNIQNEFERSLSVSKAVGLAIWLFLDTIQWLQKTRIININPLTMFFIDRTASTAWLLSIISSIVLNAFKLNQAMESDVKSPETVNFATNLIISICDVFLPLSQLGYVKSESLVGTCGTISSCLALKTFLHK